MSETLLISIISSAASLLTGGVLGHFINPKAAKKKPEIENKNADALADKVIVETAKELMEELKIDRKDADDRYDRLEEKYDKKVDELNHANNCVTLCGMLVCKHTACPLRAPEYGQGIQWLKTDFATDSIPIEEVAENKGYRIRKTKIMSSTED